MNTDWRDLEAELRKEIEGEVRFDAYSKILYSTDASIYQIEPIGVVIPRHRDDVAAVVRLNSTPRALGMPSDSQIGRASCRERV